MNTSPIELATTAPAILLHQVSKRYPHFALQDINLKLGRGTVAGLIGPNGAGKSTTMRLLMGLVKPDHGIVRVLGQPISSSEADVKQEIGYFSEDVQLYKPETIGWHMRFVRSMYTTWDDHYARDLVRRFGINENQTVKGLSHGQRVKVMMMLILARRPQLLILDEPTNGLDPVAKNEVLEELMRVVQDEDRTILYSSHQTQEIENICDTITFIDRGKVISSLERDLFLERWKRISARVPADWVAPAFSGLTTESELGNYRVFLTSDYTEALTDELARSGAELEAVETITLEEIFINVVKRGREEQPL